MKILIINGPNLNLLGTRQPEIYGDKTFDVYFAELKNRFPNVDLDYFQSNHEGALIDKLHEAGNIYNGVILNAGGYTHTSVALADAVAGIRTPVVEVHISQIFAREKFRHHSYIAPKCKGTISGFGLDSYRLALLSFLG